MRILESDGPSMRCDLKRYINVIVIIIFDPGTKFPGNEKIRYAIKKYKNQTGMNLSLLLLLLHKTVMQSDGIVPLNQNGESLK